MTRLLKPIKTIKPIIIFVDTKSNQKHSKDLTRDFQCFDSSASHNIPVRAARFEAVWQKVSILTYRLSI